MSQSETVTIRLPAEVKGKLEALAASTNAVNPGWQPKRSRRMEEQSWQIQQIEELAESEQAG